MKTYKRDNQNLGRWKTISFVLVILMIPKSAQSSQGISSPMYQQCMIPWAQSPHPKWHLGGFRHFCRAH